MPPSESDTLARAVEPFFRALPQPAYLCRLLRDEAGRAHDLVVLDANDAARRGPALLPAELLGTSLREAYGGAILEPYLVIAASVLASGTPDSFDTGEAPDGRRYLASVHAVGEDLLGFVAMDVTERRLAEEALAASEARYRTLLDDLKERAQVIGHDWRWRYVNRRVATAHDGLLADAVGRSVFEVYPGFEGSPVHERLRRVMDDRVPCDFEAPFTFPDGTTSWFDFRVQPVPEGIFIITVDITERHLAQEALTARTRELQRAVADLEEAREVAGLGVWHRDLLTGVGTWSPQMYLLFGGEPDATSPAPEVVERVLDPDTVRRRDEAIAESARTGQPWEIEAEVHPPGGDSRWMVWRGITETDAERRPVAVRGTAMDITMRKRAELVLRDFNADLERRVAERTAELEAANDELRAFSYSVSHDLRAPVRAIAGFARLLELRNGDQLDEDGRHRLHNVVTAGEHLGRLIDDLLAYSRVGRAGVRAEPVPIEPLMDGIRTACAELLDGSGGRIDLEPPLAVPLADPALLDSVLLNLVANALKYRRPDVVPVVTVGARRDGDEVVIQVADNGIGIPAEFREAVFEPFRRLVSDEAYPGTGIGLAIVRRSVRAMGGEVTVASEPGSGSTFTVVLPAELRPDPN
jgi:PAS domain S-box-containing protein